MNKIYILILMLLACCLEATNAEGDILEISFDRNQWVLAHESKDATKTVSEYVLKGQSIDNWTHLVCVEELNSYRWDEKNVGLLKEYYQNYMSSKRAQTSSIIKSGIIGVNDNDLIFDWHIPKKWFRSRDTSQVQYAMIKVLPVAPQKTFIYTFMTKQLSSVGKAKKIWTPIARSIVVKRASEIITEIGKVDKKILKKPFMKVFYNNELNYSLTLPSDWCEHRYMDLDNTQGKYCQYSSPDEQITVLINYQNVLNAPLHFQNNVKFKILENAMPHYGDYQRIDFIKHVSGNKIPIYLFKVFNQEKNSHLMHVLCPKALMHQYIEMSVFVKPELYESYLPVINKALSSFVIHQKK